MTNLANTTTDWTAGAVITLLICLLIGAAAMIFYLLIRATGLNNKAYNSQLKANQLETKASELESALDTKSKELESFKAKLARRDERIKQLEASYQIALHDIAKERVVNQTLNPPRQRPEGG